MRAGNRQVAGEIREQGEGGRSSFKDRNPGKGDGSRQRQERQMLQNATLKLDTVQMTDSLGLRS